MDEKLREFLSAHFNEPTAKRFEKLYNRVREINAKLDGPSYLTKTDVAILIALCEIVASPPKADSQELNKGDVVTYKIDGNNISGEFLGKGPGGRYKVANPQGEVVLLPKELVNG